MGIIIRQSIQNSILSYLGIVLGFISTILLFPNILTQDQYGLTRVLLSVSVICMQLSQLGMKQIIIRYFPYYKDKPDAKKRLLTLGLMVSATGYVLIAALLFFFHDTLIAFYSERSGLVADYFFYLVPLVFAILFFEVLNSFIHALKDSVTGSFVNEVLIRFLVILLLIAYFFGLMSFQSFMMIYVGIYCIQPFYLIAYLAVKKELNFSFPFQKETLRFYKGMSVYGAYSVLGGLAGLLIGNVDIIMLSTMVSLESTAVYAIAFYIGSVIAVPQRSIGKIASPILADMIKAKEMDKVESLYRRTAINQFLAGSLIYVGIWANLHNLIDLLPADYAGIYWVVVIIGLANLFNMATGVNGKIIINSRHYRFDLYTNVLLVVLTILTNYLLIPVYGIVGAAMATAFSIFFYNLVKFAFVWIKFDMQPFHWNAAAVLAISVACLLISEQIPYLFNFYIDVIIRSLIILILFVSSILIFRLSDDFQRLIYESIRRLRKLKKLN